MTKKQKAAGCNCVDLVNKQLAERNAAVTIELLINFKTGKTSESQPSIRIHKLDSKKRSRVPVMFCAYCPFCGEKYSK